VAIPAAEAGLGTVTVVGFDVDDPATTDATAVTTQSETVYVSGEHLYLASSAYRFGWEICCWDGPQVGAPDVRAPEVDSAVGSGEEGTTYLYDFDLRGVATTYAASGQVDGTIANRWSMDEYDGMLRVAVGPSLRTGNFNSIVTLSREGGDLLEAGRVDKLGVGEQIRSMRWFDELAVMVTFRQTDPFYAVDLTDPFDPRLLGELKIPGFSSYLHPIDGDLMIGMGSSASADTGAVSGAKMSLFDISDLTAPRQLDSVAYPAGTTAQAALDPRQFTWLPDRRIALTVISSGYDGRTGYVSVLRVGEGEVTNELVEVEYGIEVDDVRLVPLPDDRVVLSTGDAVSFFDLGG
jgi:Beta propeller domain